MVTMSSAVALIHDPNEGLVLYEFGEDPLGAPLGPLPKIPPRFSRVLSMPVDSVVSRGADVFFLLKRPMVVGYELWCAWIDWRSIHRRCYYDVCLFMLTKKG
jgi:hypothetical protein